MKISREELRRQSIVTKASLTAVGVLWCVSFALVVLFDAFGAAGLIFWLCLAASILSFLYVATALLVTWAYDSGKDNAAPNALFDGWNPLKRMVVREAVKGPPAGADGS